MMRKRLKYLIPFIGMVLLILAGCGGSSESSSGSGGTKKLVVVDWGGSITEVREKTLFEPFEKEHDVEIVVETPTDYGKFKAMVESGNVTWDVVNVDNDFSLRGAKEGLLEPLDFNVIDKDGFEGEMVSDYSIGAEFYSTAIAFHSEGESKPQTWIDFWDTEAFPGTRALQKKVSPSLEIALLADGVKPEELYPLDVERAFKSLEKIKDDVKVWWTTGAQAPQILSDESVVYSSAWNGRISSAQKEGSPVDQDLTQAILAGESWVIPKGSKNKDLAMEFIAYASKPEVQAEFSKNIDYSPANTKAIELLPDDVKERLGVFENSTVIIKNEEWWLDTYDELDARFQEWLLQ